MGFWGGDEVDQLQRVPVYFEGVQVQGTLSTSYAGRVLGLSDLRCSGKASRSLWRWPHSQHSTAQNLDAKSPPPLSNETPVNLGRPPFPGLDSETGPPSKLRRRRRNQKVYP